MRIIRIILFPVSIIYAWITSFRNFLFDIKFFKEHTFSNHIISIGNLSVGGTGKSPHIIYLIELFKDNYKIATLSRGYGRKTQGVLIVDEEATTETICDEPYLYYLRYGSSLLVAVAERRNLGVKRLNNIRQSDIILLDDAYQHRSIARDSNILLTDYFHPFYGDFVLPYGELREKRKEAKRADIIIVTKSPEDLSINDQDMIASKIHKYTSAPVFFTSVKYGELQNVLRKLKEVKKVIAFSGVAKPQKFEDYLASQYQLVDSIRFKDHNEYSRKDLKHIYDFWSSKKDKDIALVTTEKDWVRLIEKESFFRDVPLYYLPISIVFLDREEEFRKLLKL